MRVLDVAWSKSRRLRDQSLPIVFPGFGQALGRAGPPKIKWLTFGTPIYLMPMAFVLITHPDGTSGPLHGPNKPSKKVLKSGQQ